MSGAVSDHFNGKTFFNRDHVNRTWRDVWRWRRTSRPARWPAQLPPIVVAPPPCPAEGVAVTWIGHATFLGQTRGLTFLTDPHFGARCGPFDLVGPRRVRPPAIALADLPRIDVVLLTHDHYDHCHLPTLRFLARRDGTMVIAPLGHRALLARAGVKRLVELDWWQEHALANGGQVTLTPARHWSNRFSGRRNGRLWGGFFVRSGGTTLWNAGDTGYDAEMFKEIRRRLGAPDGAMIPIGAYEPRWFMAPQHCNPAEAVLIHREVGATTSVAMHWGTWRLTDEAWDEPPRALAAARSAAGVAEEAFRVVPPGATVQFGRNPPEVRRF